MNVLSETGKAGNRLPENSLDLNVLSETDGGMNVSETVGNTRCPSEEDRNAGRPPEEDNSIHRFEPLWGAWRTEAFLGEGSYGKVWKISRTEGGQTEERAVKEIRIPSSGGMLGGARAEGMDMDGAQFYFQGVLQNTLEEVRMMRELSDCEQIVRFENCLVRKLDRKGEFGWAVFLRIELLQAFRERMMEEVMTVRDVALLGIHICRALETCARHGIVHRDIKPDNLFYCAATDTYKLGDFGIAHHLARPTAGKGRAGTLSHMCPEVYRGEPFTEKADLYALGIILYRLLNDNRIPMLPPYPEPFTPACRDEALIRRLRGEEPGLPRLADENICSYRGIGVRVKETEVLAVKELGRIARKAIAARPEERFPSAEALREALEALEMPDPEGQTV